MPMFTTPVTQSYTYADATAEIVVMLAVAFLLGALFHYLWVRAQYRAMRAAGAVQQRPAQFAAFAEDDLKIVEGIGPKIEALLKENGVQTWKDLAMSDVEALRAILRSGGDRFKMHDPSSWKDQAALAVEGKWDELASYQDILNGGRER